jgi:cytoskeletal protein CcmA (bactofilin family)
MTDSRRVDNVMAKNDSNVVQQPGREGVISIIGPGMRVIGDCKTEGTLRIEGSVEGTVRAGKAVVWARTASSMATSSRRTP